MSGLKRILRETTDRKLTTGGAISPALVKALRAHRSQQFAIFVALEVVIVIFIALSVFLVFKNPDQTTRNEVIAATLGISAGAGGGIELIRRIWREWTQTSLLLLLVEEASEAQVNSILERLIQKL